MTNRIEMDKKYKTRDGKDVRILCVDAPGHYPVVFLLDKDVRTCTSSGNFLLTKDKKESPFDLIEVTPFAEFKKDDHVMVRDIDNESWKKRYFSHEKDGIAYCFVDSGTSWSETQTIVWNQCRKPTPEELE